MLSHIQTGDFFFCTNAQADGLLDNEEHDCDDDCHIGCNAQYAKGLNTQEVEATAVKYAFFSGNTSSEETGEDRAQTAADTVNGHSTNRVVDLCNLIKKFNGKHNNNTKDGTHDSSTQRRNSITASGDAHQTSQRCIVSHGNIRLSVANPGKDQSHTAGYRSRQVGVEEDQTGAGNRFIGIHSHGGSTVETKPAEP